MDDINSRYEKAVASDASQEAIDAIRAEGREMNKKTLSAFKYAQDHLMGVILTSDIVIKHAAYQANIETLSAVTAALEKGDLSNEDETSGALDNAWKINGGAEFSYYTFSPKTAEASEETLLEAKNPGNVFWGTGKGCELADTKAATLSLLEKAAAMEPGKKTTYENELAVYRKAIKHQQSGLAKAMAHETKAMQQLAESLK